MLTCRALAPAVAVAELAEARAARFVAVAEVLWGAIGANLRKWAPRGRNRAHDRNHDSGVATLRRGSGPRDACVLGECPENALLRLRG